jgi:ketosteroid isomerase-like protein
VRHLLTGRTLKNPDKMSSKTLAIATLLFCLSSNIFGQKPIKTKQPKAVHSKQDTTQIYKEIVKVDSAFFQAFNNCDTVTYRTFLTIDLEFFHDLGGLHFLPTEMQSMREMCAMNSHIRRELLKSTLEVYKLGNFGAVEIGVHRIYHTNPGQTEHISGEYKFIHVWEKKAGFWKLKRIISYGHEKMNNN